jgi:hypothetical protein
MKNFYRLMQLKGIPCMLLDDNPNPKQFHTYEKKRYENCTNSVYFNGG